MVGAAPSSWTTCHSFPPTNLTTEHLNHTPPSHWERADVDRYCFLNRNLSEDSSRYSSLSPGTALLQHWLADFFTNENPSLDPFNEFPSMHVMKQYPDISFDGDIVIDDNTSISAPDYYTLWYTTTISASGSNADSNEFGSSASNSSRQKRGHLTLHGVNYQPIVYCDGELLQPYSTFVDLSNEEVNVGGMFIRRHFDLGTLNGNQDVPLEILVLPPPVVGKPTSDSNSTKKDDLQSHLKAWSTTSRRLATSERDKANEPQGQGGNHDLAQSGAIMQCTAGWDWIQPTPDRNTGIWDKVEIDWIWGDVRLHDVRVKVIGISPNIAQEDLNNGANDDEALPRGDDVSVTALLDLSVTATLHSQESVAGKFHYEINELGGTSVLATGSIEISITQTVTEYSLGQIQLMNAKLWWPHTLGSQPMYEAVITFQSNETDQEEISIHESQTQSTFGIRTISSYTHHKTKSLSVQVNGHSIFLVGGNWITTDQFLRFSTSQRRYMQELLHMKNIGFNAIRVWGGGITETASFYNAADRLGLLVYQEFWMTGDNNGRMAGSYDWPLDHNAYLRNTKDVIRRLYNHPSLIMYGGGNELLSSDSGASPPVDIDEGLKSYIASLDGTRMYVSSSVTSVGSDFDPMKSLGPKDGPYGILDEALFFDRNPGLTSPLLSNGEIDNSALPSDLEDINSAGRNIGFQTEIGSVSHPELTSLERFLTRDALESFPACGVIDEHSNATHEEWIYFKYLPFTENESGVDHICQFRYPSINSTINQMESIEDYTWSAQLAQYFQYKALFEGYFHRMFEDHSAVFLWKSSSPAPTLRGALYDWYLNTNGGYWGARSGIGNNNPLRVLLNLKDWSIHLVNTMALDTTASSVQWSAYTLDGELADSGALAIPNNTIKRNSATHLQGKVPWVGAHEIALVPDLKLQEVLLYRFEIASEEAFASNMYYLADPSKQDSADRKSRYALLGAMREALPKVSIDTHCMAEVSSTDIECFMENEGKRVAIMVKLSIVGYQTRSDSIIDPILPAYFSNNYITLLPGESTHVHIDFNDAGVVCADDVSTTNNSESSTRVMLLVEGWNVNDDTVSVSCSVNSEIM